MSDYMAESPLWVEGVMRPPEEFGLSPDLVAGLREWENHFLAHFDHESGWDSVATRDWYRVRTDGLLAALRDELDDTYEVKANLWPLS
jgi:hypothetical protein